MCHAGITAMVLFLTNILEKHDSMIVYRAIYYDYI